MNKKAICSRWDRYLGMTAVMTQVPVPSTAILLPQARTKGKGNRLCGLGEF